MSQDTSDGSERTDRSADDGITHVNRRSVIKGTGLAGIVSIAGCVGGDGGDGGGDGDGGGTTTTASGSGELTKILAGENAAGAFSLPMVVAGEKGFAEDHGIEFEFQQYQFGIQYINRMATGEGLLMGGNGASWAYLSGAAKGPVGLFANHFGWLEGVSFVTQDDITESEDLKGIKIPTVEGAIWDYLIFKMLDNQGLSFDDVNVVGVSSGADMLSGLQQGNFGGSWMWSQFLEKATDSEGLHTFGTALEMVPQTMDSWGILPVNAEWARNNPEVAANALRAIDEGDKWVSQNQKQAAEFVNDRYDIPVQQAFNQLGNLNFYLNINGDYVDHYKGMAEYGVSKDYWDEFTVEDTVVTEPMERAFPDRADL